MDEEAPLVQNEHGLGLSYNYLVYRPVVEHAESRGSGFEATVNCQVCNAVVPLGNKEKQLVVKCPVCNEATPIKGPPPGKQYVRCPCNCLLICKASTTRVGCPRPQCQRVITLPGLFTIKYNIRLIFYNCICSCLCARDNFVRMNSVILSSFCDIAVTAISYEVFIYSVLQKKIKNSFVSRENVHVMKFSCHTLIPKTRGPS
ncbi:unnamed protein product [Schistocephalus solidus]|uniref:Phosphatidylinositol-4,5-bisphosphate 4-phosphatase n=1 Tax=Schistocephalus solidus TaxID=70667 RepID=A0A183TDK7_SCHSO|nr:unnamed protein product [Schistocephalus solidus]